MSATEVLDLGLSTSPSGAFEMPLPLEKFYQWEKEIPKKLYFSQPFGNGKIIDYSWQRVGDEVRRVASYLKSLNLEPGSNIGIISKNCAHWIMSDLAIWMAGHVSVPLYPTLTAESVDQILTHSSCKVLFVGKLDDWETMAPGVPKDVACLSYPLSPKNDFLSWDEILKNNEPMQENPTRSPEELSTIIYTSGTTGIPKGVVHTFGGMAATADKATELYEITGDDRIISYLPLSHVAERMVVELGSLYQSMQVYFAESLDTFAADLQRCRPTIFFAVPRIWVKFQMGVFAKMPEKKLTRMLKIPIISGIVKRKILGGLGLDQARMALSGAAPISQAVLTWYKRLGLEILEVYGMTENMAYSHGTRSGAQRVGFVGQGYPGVMTKFSSEGEVLVKSPGTMIGYYKEPEKTAEVLTEDGYLRTGDLGFMDSEGNLKITGRVKELFKTAKGKYVAPAPIEGKLLDCEHVEQVCVTGCILPQPICLLNLSEAARGKLSDPKFKEALIKELGELRSEVNGQIDKHEQMRCLVVTKEEWTVENGCLTPTLKLKRNILDDKYGSMFEAWYATGDAVAWE